MATPRIVTLYHGRPVKALADWIFYLNLDFRGETAHDFESDTTVVIDGVTWTANDNTKTSAWEIDSTGMFMTVTSADPATLFATVQAIITDYALGDELWVVFERVIGTLTNSQTHSVRFANPNDDQFAVGGSDATGVGTFSRSVDDGTASNHEVAGTEPTWAGMRVIDGFAEFLHATAAEAALLTWPPTYDDLKTVAGVTTRASLDFPAAAAYEIDASTQRVTITTQNSTSGTQTCTRIALARREYQ